MAFKVNASMLAVLEPTKKLQDCHVVAQALLNSFEAMQERIFVEGKNSFGAPIGKLSLDPGYFNPKDFPAPSGFTGKGKTGKATFKNGKAHVTTYFSEGYNKAKTAGGRNLSTPGNADMYLTGQLKNSFLPQLECGKQAVIGFTNDLSRDKAEGNESHFDTTIFDPTEKEIQIFIDTILNA